jgi:hypothetical protein
MLLTNAKTFDDFVMQTIDSSVEVAESPSVQTIHQPSEEHRQCV